MAPRSSTLAWQIPWTEEPGRLQSMGSLGVRQDWATSLSCIGEGTGKPLQCSCLENPRDGGAWWAAVNGVTQSRTWLKWLSSISNLYLLCPYSQHGPLEFEIENWQCSSSLVGHELLILFHEIAENYLQPFTILQMFPGKSRAAF